MTIVITKQGFADCSDVEPVDRLLLETSGGGRLYLAPARDPRTSRIWYPVELGPTAVPELDRLIEPCRVTACGPQLVQMVSLPLAGAMIKLRIDHQRHGERPSSPELKGVKIIDLKPMTVHDLESLELTP